MNRNSFFMRSFSNLSNFSEEKATLSEPLPEHLDFAQVFRQTGCL